MLTVLVGLVGGGGCKSEATRPNEVELAVRQLSSPSWVERLDALKRLEKAGEGAASAALDVASVLTHDQTSLCRVVAASALGTFGRRDRAIVKALRQGLADEVTMVRASSARSVARLGVDDKAVAEALGGLLSRVDEDDGAVLSALAKMGPSAAVAVPAVATYLLKTRDSFGAMPLFHLGPLAADAVPVLIELLEDPLSDPDLQASVAATLAEIGPAASAAIPVLEESAAAGVENAARALKAIRCSTTETQRTHVPK